MLDFAGFDQILDRTGDVFDRYIGVDAVLIEQIDDIGLEPLERGFGDLLDVRRPAAEAALFTSRRINVEAEFGGDNHLVAKGRERFADQFLVDERTIDFGGVEESDAALNRPADQRNAACLVDWRSVAKTQSHAAKPDGRDFKAALAEFTFLHCELLCRLRFARNQPRYCWSLTFSSQSTTLPSSAS